MTVQTLDVTPAIRRIYEAGFRLQADLAHAKAKHEARIAAELERLDREALKRLWPRARPIVIQEAERAGIRIADLLGRGRVKVLVAARQAAMVRCREEFGWSMPVIGRQFGRDHTTVLHAIRQHQARRDAEGAR